MSLADPPPVLAVAPTAAPLLDPLFVSDLHLAAERPRTIARFLRFLAEDAPGHRELVILGDLFEFWIGDDAAASARPIVDALAAYSAGGRRLLLMHGNRDPLLGHGFAAATGGTLLADPIVLDVAGTPTLLSHGDAWCTLDVAYQRFRATVRQPGVPAGLPVEVARRAHRLRARAAHAERQREVDEGARTSWT